MIPISDENPVLTRTYVNWALLATIFGVWLLVQRGGLEPQALMASVCNYGLVPGELTGRSPLGTAVPLGEGLACVVDDEMVNWLTPITSMFLHGGWMHILGNALFLWVFGNNIEDSMGHGRFLAFYLLCGLAAAAAHLVVEPASPIPTVGASGAISGVLGAYLVLYPRVRVKTIVPIFVFFTVLRLPAWGILLLWFAYQLLGGLPQLLQVRPEASGGVAFWAHIGGFLAGVLLVKPFENRDLVRRRATAGDAQAVFGTPR
jgi:membrane associated rhomboid family serine protease